MFCEVQMPFLTQLVHTVITVRKIYNLVLVLTCVSVSEILLEDITVKVAP